MEETQHDVEAWFTLYSHDLYNFLVYFTGHHDVEDLVQEVFMKAMLNKHQFRGRAARKTWLFSIARNLAIDHVRKEKWRRSVLSSFLPFFRSEEKGPDEIAERNEEFHFLYGAIRQLKQTHREVILLRGIQGFSVAETAEILDWSESKVHVTLHRGLKELRKLMTQPEKGGDILASSVK
ncbi:RNA polymerase sigma factor [Brevibacillus composti]|uniref:RNA polymerase sigma factor n=1 Tax=Brevibacillus composti TaxID=2796470 RepID=A0A7T5JN66_9BACL|nr:RNA polymerase sigma factor [Brevibacillus composti]QQE73786.1 RNA polymerase sigma factor [Brevibacillus composti]QUO40870.1 RNA polymerase sigma factor [Brevibacillus composti]